MHRAVRLLLAALLVSPALAGCITPGGEQTPDAASSDSTEAPATWAEHALPYGDDHDHDDPLHHQNLSTPNFEVLGWSPLETKYHGATSGGYLCGEAVPGEERTLSFIHSYDTDVALVIADVTDPAKPQVLGELVLPYTHVYDAAAFPDQQYVVLATSQGDNGPDEGADKRAPYFRDACTGDERELPVAGHLAAAAEENVPYKSGVVLVDVSDPANPKVADYRPLPLLGGHSVFATELDGKRVALASVTNLVHPGSYYQFLTVEDTPLGAKLVAQSTWRPPADANAPVLNGHVDGWIAEHPITGDPLAYLADWNGGLAIVDVSDLKTPRTIGHWSNYRFSQATEGFGDNSGSIHGAYPISEAWGDKHYTLIGQEVLTHPRDTPTGVIYIVDTTDPTNPTPVGAWTLPVEVEWEETLQFSTHYFRVVNHTMFVAMYHGGVWAVNITDPANPQSVGVFIPANAPPKPSGLPMRIGWSPSVLDLEALPDGTLVVWDGPSGVYTVAYDESNPAPAPAPWPIELMS